jgi:hypothetical protein
MLKVGDIVEVVSLTKEEQDRLDFPDLINGIQFEGYLGVILLIKENYDTVVFNYLQYENIPLSMLKLYNKGGST